MYIPYFHTTPNTAHPKGTWRWAHRAFKRTAAIPEPGTSALKRRPRGIICMHKLNAAGSTAISKNMDRTEPFQSKAGAVPCALAPRVLQPAAPLRAAHRADGKEYHEGILHGQPQPRPCAHAIVLTERGRLHPPLAPCILETSQQEPLYIHHSTARCKITEKSIKQTWHQGRR